MNYSQTIFFSSGRDVSSNTKLVSIFEIQETKICLVEIRNLESQNNQGHVLIIFFLLLFAKKIKKKKKMKPVLKFYAIMIKNRTFGFHPTTGSFILGLF